MQPYVAARGAASVGGPLRIPIAGTPMRRCSLRERLTAQGEHPIAIQLRLGHSSIQITLHTYGACLKVLTRPPPTAWTPRFRGLSRALGSSSVVELFR